MSGFTCYLDYLTHLKNSPPNYNFSALAEKTFTQALSALQAKECYARGVDDRELNFYSIFAHADTKYDGANLINLGINELCDPCYFRPILRSGATGLWKHNQGGIKPSAKYSKKHSGALISDDSGISRDYDVYFLHDDRLTNHKLTCNGEDKYAWILGAGTDYAPWFSPYGKNNTKAGDTNKKQIQHGIGIGECAYNEVLRGLSLESLLGMGCQDSSKNSRLKLLEVYTREMTSGNAERKSMGVRELPKLPLVLHSRTSVKEYTVVDMKRDLKNVLDKKTDVYYSGAKESARNIMRNLGVSETNKTTKEIVDDFANKFKPFATKSATQAKATPTTAP